MALSVGVLRECFRNLHAFRSLYECEGIDTLVALDGTEINLFDLEYLYEQLWRLPHRQRQAIEMCLVQNIKESEAAVLMGVSVTNPVAMYATLGLNKLLVLITDGVLPRFCEGYFATDQRSQEAS